MCHGLHLTVKDICDEINWLKLLVDDIKELIYFIYRHHKVLSELKDELSKRKKKNLAKPAATRWGRIKVK